MKNIFSECLVYLAKCATSILTEDKKYEEELSADSWRLLASSFRSRPASILLTLSI